MSRIRLVVAATCFALLLLAALPGAAIAQRGARMDVAITHSEAVDGWFVRSAVAWGDDALSWLQAIFAADHGQIVPIVPPPPIVSPDPPDSTDRPDPTVL